jgi:hypothetical protein
VSFTLAYAKRIFMDDVGMQVTGLLFTPLMIAAIVLRLMARRRKVQTT